MPDYARGVARCSSVRTIVILALLVAAAGPAHAMGSDVSYDLVAWNQDGSSALLRRTASSEGDASVSYVLATVDDDPRLDVVVSQTERASRAQQVDRATCTESLRDLARALAAHHFRGVTVHPARCRHADRRGAVVVRDAVADAAERSWVGSPEETSTDPDCTESIAVANGGGALILVFRTPMCGAPVQVQVTPLVLAGGSYQPSGLLY